MDRPILIVGYPRSGTTLLRDLLRAHSRITLPGDSQILPRLLRIHGDPPDARAARRLAGDLLALSRIRRWGLALTPADLEHHRSFAALVADVYAAWARKEGKPRWGEKTPVYVADLPAALRVFPTAQVIHIVRDPRAVVASALRQPWGRATVRTTAAQWNAWVGAGRRNGRALDKDSYLEVRYEDLVADPERVLRDVCAYVDEEFDPGMLRPNRLTMPPADPLPWWRLPEQERDIVASPPGVAALDAAARAVVAAEAGPLMEELGYGPIGPTRPARPGELPLLRLADLFARVRYRFTGWDRRGRVEDDLIFLKGRLRAAFRPR